MEAARSARGHVANGDKAPTLYAVVEAPTEAPAFVAALPPQPWPAFVRLFGETSAGDVSLVVARLGRYGPSAELPQIVGDLVRHFPHIAPGGLAAVDGTVSVVPSCCCGLEKWREWHNLLRDGTSPWLGHDPSPWVETVGDAFVVWPDGGLGPGGSGPRPPIRFTRQQLSHALASVERDLRAFAARLQAWASVVAPDQAQGLAERFLNLVALT
jgi:hypothetical protein